MFHTAITPMPALPAGTLARGRAWLAAWRARRHQADLEAMATLRGLSAHTLRDIGAPEWLQQQAQGRWLADLDRLRL